MLPNQRYCPWVSSAQRPQHGARERANGTSKIDSHTQRSCRARIAPAGRCCRVKDTLSAGLSPRRPLRCGSRRCARRCPARRRRRRPAPRRAACCCCCAPRRGPFHTSCTRCSDIYRGMTISLNAAASSHHSYHHLPYAPPPPPPGRRCTCCATARPR